MSVDVSVHLSRSELLFLYISGSIVAIEFNEQVVEVPRPQRTCRRVGDVEGGDWADGGESDERAGRTVASREKRFSCRVEESFGEISSIEVDDE